MVWVPPVWVMVGRAARRKGQGSWDHLPGSTVTWAGEDHLPRSMVTWAGEDHLPRSTVTWAREVGWEGRAGSVNWVD